MPLALEFNLDPKSQKVLINIEDLNKLTKKSIRRAFIFIGKDLRTISRQFILKGPKTGIIYRKLRAGRGITRRRRVRDHRASALGESPANETGRLRRSIGWRFGGGNSIDFGASAESDKGFPYARQLELEMDRPYLIRAIRERQKVTENYFRKEISLLNKAV